MNEGTRMIAIMTPFTKPMSEPESIAAMIATGGKMSTFRKYTHHDASQHRDRSKREINLTQQQYQRNAHAQNCNRTDLYYKVRDITRFEKEPPGRNLEEDCDDDQREQDRNE